MRRDFLARGEIREGRGWCAKRRGEAGQASRARQGPRPGKWPRLTAQRAAAPDSAWPCRARQRAPRPGSAAPRRGRTAQRETPSSAAQRRAAPRLIAPDRAWQRCDARSLVFFRPGWLGGTRRLPRLRALRSATLHVGRFAGRPRAIVRRGVRSCRSLVFQGTLRAGEGGRTALNLLGPAFLWAHLDLHCAQKLHVSTRRPRVNQSLESHERLAKSSRGGGGGWWWRRLRRGGCAIADRPAPLLPCQQWRRMQQPRADRAARVAYPAP